MFQWLTFYHRGRECTLVTWNGSTCLTPINNPIKRFTRMLRVVYPPVTKELISFCFWIYNKGVACKMAVIWHSSAPLPAHTLCQSATPTSSVNSIKNTRLYQKKEERIFKKNTHPTASPAFSHIAWLLFSSTCKSLQHSSPQWFPFANPACLLPGPLILFLAWHPSCLLLF